MKANFKNQLIQAYVSLALTRKDASGLRTVVLDHYGLYEIRLFESERRDDTEAVTFWIELIDLANRCAIDSFCSTDLSKMADAFEQLILQAKQLDRDSTSMPRSIDC